MLIERKTVVTNVTFTKEEIQMFKNLKKIISECCDSDCSTLCPFYGWCCATYDVIEELDNFENLEEG